MRLLDLNDDNKKPIEEINESNNIDAKLLWGKIDKGKILNIQLTGPSSSIINQQDFNLAYFIMMNKNCSPKYWLCVGINELKVIISGYGNVLYNDIIYQNNNKILEYRHIPLYFLEAENKQRGFYLLTDINKKQVEICFFNICSAPVKNANFFSMQSLRIYSSSISSSSSTYSSSGNLSPIRDREEMEIRLRVQNLEREIANGYSSFSSNPSTEVSGSGHPDYYSPTYAEAMAIQRNGLINPQIGETNENNTYSYDPSNDDTYPHDPSDDDTYPDLPF